MKNNKKTFGQKLLKTIWGAIPSVIIILLLGLLAYSLLGKIQQEKDRIKSEKEKALNQEQHAPQVIAQEIQAKPLEDRLNLPGVISPWEDLLVRVQVSGQIIEVPVKEGNIVHQGQVLARIDPRDYEHHLAQAEAAYNFAKLEYDRFATLSKSNATSKAQLDISLTRLKETEANLASARLDLERTAIVAPMSGYINQLDAKIGLLVNRFDPIAQILDTGKVKVEVGIPESDIHPIQSLKEAQITVEALGGEKFIGEKIFLSRQPDSASRVYTLKLAVNNPEGLLRPGMFARVELVKHLYQEAISIPLYAVIARENEQFVYTVNDGTAHYRKVELGILNGFKVQITEGLKEGDRVIIVGQRSLEDGQKVVLQRVVQDSEEIKKIF